MPTDNLVWISDKEWRIFGRNGKNVPYGSEGRLAGWNLYLTDLHGESWEYHPRFIAVNSPRFVQDVGMDLLVPHMHQYRTPSNIERVVLSPLEALRMVASGIRQECISSDTFEAAYDDGSSVAVIDRVDFLYQGERVTLPVRIVDEFRLQHRGYLVLKR